MVDAYAARLADTPAAREALRTIIDRAIDDAAPDQLPPEVADAYAVLDRESGLGAGGEGAEPGSDREPFDPERVYRAVQEEEAVSFGGFGLGRPAGPAADALVLDDEGPGPAVRRGGRPRPAERPAAGRPAATCGST